MKRMLTTSYACGMEALTLDADIQVQDIDTESESYSPQENYVAIISTKDDFGEASTVLTLTEASQLWLALGQIVADAMINDPEQAVQACKRSNKLADTKQDCKRNGCDKPLAYKGARFCGAACAARHEAGQ